MTYEDSALNWRRRALAPMAARELSNVDFQNGIEERRSHRKDMDVVVGVVECLPVSGQAHPS